MHSALERVHEAGIAHKDLGGDNMCLLLGKKGQVRAQIIDLGISVFEDGPFFEEEKDDDLRAFEMFAKGIRETMSEQAKEAEGRPSKETGEDTPELLAMMTEDEEDEEDELSDDAESQSQPDETQSPASRPSPTCSSSSSDECHSDESLCVLHFSSDSSSPISSSSDESQDEDGEDFSDQRTRRLLKRRSPSDSEEDPLDDRSATKRRRQW